MHRHKNITPPSASAKNSAPQNQPPTKATSPHPSASRPFVGRSCPIWPIKLGVQHRQFGQMPPKRQDAAPLYYPHR